MSSKSAFLIWGPPQLLVARVLLGSTCKYTGHKNMIIMDNIENSEKEKKRG